MPSRAQINLAYINSNADLNIRKEYGELDDLKASIKTLGVQIPIRVVKVADPESNGGKAYRLDDGFRRVLACRTLVKEGVYNAESGDSLEILEATIIEDDVPRRDLLKQQLAINCVRKNLTVLEEAETIQELLELGEPIDSIQTQFGIKKMAIDQRLKLLEAPSDIKEAVQTQQVEFSAARALQRITDEDERTKLLSDAIENSWSTREVEDQISKAADAAEKEGKSIKKRRKRKKGGDTISKKIRNHPEIMAYLEQQQDNLAVATDDVVVAELTGWVRALQWVLTPDSANTVAQQ
jgi:ParB/RepB/Spo0J family partition protein